MGDNTAVTMFHEKGHDVTMTMTHPWALGTPLVLRRHGSRSRGTYTSYPQPGTSSGQRPEGPGSRTSETSSASLR